METIAEAESLWRSNRPLEAGRVLLAGVARDKLPVWGARILRQCCDLLNARPEEIENVERIASSRELWSEGHAAFDSVRELVLQVESDPERDDLFVGALFLAENVARVAYNASSPPDPFDEDSAWWVVSNAHWVATRAPEGDVKQRLWDAVSQVR